MKKPREKTHRMNPGKNPANEPREKAQRMNPTKSQGKKVCWRGLWSTDAGEPTLSGAIDIRQTPQSLNAHKQTPTCEGGSSYVRAPAQSCTRSVKRATFFAAFRSIARLLC